MRGFTTGKLGEPLLNPSYLNLSREKAPAGGLMAQVCRLNGRRAVRANGIQRLQAPTKQGDIYQDFEIPRAGQYVSGSATLIGPTRVKTSQLRIAQDGAEIFRSRVWRQRLIDPHDEVSHVLGLGLCMGQRAESTLKKGPARFRSRSRKLQKHGDTSIVCAHE